MIMVSEAGSHPARALGYRNVWRGARKSQQEANRNDLRHKHAVLGLVDASLWSCWEEIQEV